MNDQEIVPEDRAPEDKAFNHASAGLQFDGTPLAAYCPARERAAQAMGMRAPLWKPDDIATIQKGGVYTGAMRDVTVFLWLCSIPTAGEQQDENTRERATAKAEGRKPVFKNTWTVQAADRSPEEAYDEACKFCEERGVLMGSNKFMDAYAMLVKKGMEILDSRFNIEGGSSGEGDSPNV